MASFYKHGIEKSEEFLDQLFNYQLFKKDLNHVITVIIITALEQVP